MWLDVVKQRERRRGWKTVPWTGQPVEELRRQTTAKHATGIDLRGGPDADVSWLPSIPNLMWVMSMDPLRNDEAVWDVSTLEALLLANSSRKPAHFDRLPSIRSVQLDWRKGLASASDHPSLEDLTVWRVADKDLSWFRAGETLWQLNLVARRSKAILDIAGADLRGIQALTLDSVRAGDFSALRTATQLEGLGLDGVSLLSASARDDLLGSFATMPNLRQVVMFVCSGVTRDEVREALPDQVALTFTP